MRKKNSIINMIVGLVGQLLNMLLSFGGRMVFVHYLSQEYLGVNGLFGDVLMSARTVGSPVELRTARQSRVLFLSLDALLQCCARDGGQKCTRLLSNLLEEISEKYWAQEKRVRLLSIPDGSARLEHYLTEEAQKTGAVVCAGVTRERMAQYLGMNRSALSRLLGAMQREGRVELHRGWLRLLVQDAPENE